MCASGDVCTWEVHMFSLLGHIKLSVDVKANPVDRVWLETGFTRKQLNLVTITFGISTGLQEIM